MNQMKLLIVLAVLLTVVMVPQAQTANSSEKDRVIAIGKEASGILLSSLKKELQEAISTRGPLHAIDVCSEKAMPLTEAVLGTDMPKGISLKRTSFRYRNSKNAPDSYEAEALHFFEKAISSEREMPQHYVQKMDNEYRYYRPLTVAPQCLTCHGTKDVISGDVLKQIQGRYPGDKATGYSAGDFRGVVRVSIPIEGLQR
jgi:hypothetical protein